MTQKCHKLKNIAIIRIKKCVYRICFLFMNKHEAKKLMANSNVIDHNMSEEKKQELREYHKQRYQEIKGLKIMI